MAKKKTTRKDSTPLLQKLTLILCVAGLILTIVSLCTREALSALFFVDLIEVVMYGAVLFYAAYGYKIPHGNLFRYTLVFYAMLLVFMVCLTAKNDWSRLLLLVAAVAVAYMSVSLGKLKVTSIIIPAVEVLFLITSVLTIVLTHPDALLTQFNQPIIWTCLSLAYLTRFQQHIDAGKNVPKEVSE